MPLFAQQVTSQVDPDEIRGLVTAFLEYAEDHKTHHGSTLTATVLLFLFLMDPHPEQAIVDQETVQLFLDKWSADVAAHQLTHHPDLDTTPQ